MIYHIETHNALFVTIQLIREEWASYPVHMLVEISGLSCSRMYVTVVLFEQRRSQDTGEMAMYLKIQVNFRRKN
ncbi:hypothetical protein XELAEV_18047326mg [Xenopus laevis]|uniref:Uncharacterized protein n=1 Tax=Xenopus laevis TaxID=8355 RepID=A0A974BV23_XENLA|nr:hypothetical protein XELAEV_18047326mg [Xenopus laevis]